MMIKTMTGASLEHHQKNNKNYSVENGSQQEKDREFIEDLKECIVEDLNKSKKINLQITTEDEEKIKERIKKMDNDEFLSMISMAFANVNNNLSVLNILIGIAEGGETDDIRKAKQIVKRNVKKINRWFKTDLKVV